MKPLTHRQQQVLDYIRDHISNIGYPPTLREIAGQFDLSGPRASVKHLEALQRKGHIRRSPSSSRGIEILSRENTARTYIRDGIGGNMEVPILGTVPAGPLDLAIQEEENTMILDPSIAVEGTFLLRVKGDSMTGDHILPGDMVLVKKQDTANEGDLVVVLIGEEATLKRFKRDGEKITLLPSNPDYQPVVVDGNSEEIKIVGKINAVIRITDR
jgi:repressor LexA